MKIKFLIFSLVITLFFSINSNAQDKNSNTLVVQGFRGNLKIEGYAGDTISVSVKPNETPFVLDKQRNITYFRTASVQMSEYVILVPYQTYLKIHWTDEGNIDIKKIKSGIELQSRKGKIVLSEIKGWAFVQNDDGDIEADFAEITPQKPISFTNLTGDITLNIPENTNAHLETQTENSQVENDFNTTKNKEHKTSVNGNMANNGSFEKKRNLKYNLPKKEIEDIGNNGAVFKLNSRKGKIKIKKRF
ncbi:MAG: hypothetical protein EAZ20_14040 [Bacteroidetes bacterium]|nr:MAG: hypothetical protein EAZ20_14040 [Bacteroidota bacterium]